MYEYFLMGLCVLLVCIAFLILIITGAILEKYREVILTKQKTNRGLLVFSMVVSLAMILLALYTSQAIYQNLSANEPEVVSNFWKWYSAGVFLRLCTLYNRGSIFSRHLMIDFEEVFFGLFVAIIGPFEAIRLAYEGWKINPPNKK